MKLASRLLARHSVEMAASILAVITLGLAAGHAATAPVEQSPVVKAYRSWVRVTQKRVPMDLQVAVDCAAAPPVTPHSSADFHVYVNAVGKQALTRDRHPTYPAGTVVVKEKFAFRAAQPHLLTVMRKRERGFDAANGDWEYLVQELPNGVLTAPENAESCRACHEKARDRDFVYRDYLPKSVQRQRQ